MKELKLLLMSGEKHPEVIVFQSRKLVSLYSRYHAMAAIQGFKLREEVWNPPALFSLHGDRRLGAINNGLIIYSVGVIPIFPVAQKQGEFAERVMFQIRGGDALG